MKTRDTGIGDEGYRYERTLITDSAGAAVVPDIAAVFVNIGQLLSLSVPLIVLSSCVIGI